MRLGIFLLLQVGHKPFKTLGHGKIAGSNTAKLIYFVQSLYMQFSSNTIDRT